jgi:AcrR family transcriptional regulator
MREIADQAGVNRALLHCHFRSAVWLRIASSFVPGIVQMMASHISLDRRSTDSSIPIARLAKHPYLLGYIIREVGIFYPG